LAINKLRKTFWKIADIKSHLKSMSPADIRQFTQVDFRKNLPALEITFSENLGDIGGASVPLGITNGLQVLSVRPSNGEFPFLISTGMMISLPDSSIASAYTVVGKGSDFLPRMGKFEGTKFETDLRRIEISVGGKNLKLSFGVFPEMIEESALKGIGVMGILGDKLFANTPVGFSYRRQELIFL